jgi:hypothetical protein
LPLPVQTCKNPRKHRSAKEKLQIPGHIWYKVSRSERVSYNGITPASQADNEGSIPFTRSNQISVSRRFLTGDAGKEKTGLDGRFFYVWSLVEPGSEASPHFCPLSADR